MSENDEGARIQPLADCPYCAGEGTDPETVLGICRHCYGRGRVARFLAERTLARWARQNSARDGQGESDDGIEDEVPPGYVKARRHVQRRPEDGRPRSRQR